MSFQYIIDKNAGAPFESEPFRHIHLNDFFRADQFKKILAANQVRTPIFRSDEELFEKLFALG